MTAGVDDNDRWMATAAQIDAVALVAPRCVGVWLHLLEMFLKKVRRCEWRVRGTICRKKSLQRQNKMIAASVVLLMGGGGLKHNTTIKRGDGSTTLSRPVPWCNDYPVEASRQLRGPAGGGRTVFARWMNNVGVTTATVLRGASTRLRRCHRAEISRRLRGDRRSDAQAAGQANVVSCRIAISRAVLRYLVQLHGGTIQLMPRDVCADPQGEAEQCSGGWTKTTMSKSRRLMPMVRRRRLRRLTPMDNIV
jgi:hypothetical protein